jgi:hypothetical protein
MRSYNLLLPVLFIAIIPPAQGQQPLTLDTSFRTTIYAADVPGWVPNAQPEAWINDIWPMADGKLLISGRFSFFDSWNDGSGWPGGLGHYGLAVLNQDGSRYTGYEPSYGTGGRITEWNNRLYISGWIMRYFLNGTLDTAFNMTLMGVNGPITGQPWDFHIMPDSTIMVVGNFDLHDTANSISEAYNVIWLDSLGHFLPSKPLHRIDWGSGNGNIDRIFPLNDGSFILTGPLLAYDDISVPGRMIKVEANGDLDTSFHPVALWDNIFAWGIASDILEQADGKIIAAGLFKFPGDPDTLHLIRMLPNGDLDTTFNNHLLSSIFGYGAMTFWNCVQQLDPGRLVVGGTFSTINGEPRGGIAVLDTAGHLLEEPLSGPGCHSFAPYPAGNFYPSAMVEGILQMDDGPFYLFGQYHGYSDATANDPEQRMLSRLWNMDVSIHEPDSPSKGLKVHPNPFANTTVIDFSLPTGSGDATMIIMNTMGQQVFARHFTTGQGQATFNAADLSAGLYSVVLLSARTRMASTRICLVH